MKAQLETLFGHHNLTSDAEREEELLAIPRSVIQDVYRRAKRDRDKENVSPSDKDCYDSNIKLLKGLFGSNCLPDDGDNLSPEPKPAEPKYHIGQRVRHIPTRLVDVIDGISQSAPYIYHFKHMVDPINGQGIFESDLEPYTEPTEKIGNPDFPNASKSVPLDGAEHVGDSNEKADRDLCDKLIQRGFRNHNRLHIAAMVIASIMGSNDWSDYRGATDEEAWHNMAKASLGVADALIAECEKGGES